MAQGIFLALTERDPTNTRWSRGLAEALASIGRELHTLGDVASAAEELRASVVMVGELVASDPSNTRWQRDLALARIWLGSVLATGGDVGAALHEAEGARDALASILENNATDGSAQRLLGDAYLLAGRVHARRGDQALAETNWQLAAGVIEPPLAEAEDRAVLVLWARALIHLGRIDEAAPIAAELDAIGYRDRDLELLLAH